jgi:hypothetical protein
MMKLIIAMSLIMGANAQASANRTVQADIVHATSGTNLNVPTVGSDMLSDTNAVSVTNKTMSGASNTFSLIPVGAIGNGSVLSGTNTGDVTIGTANGLSLSLQALSMALSSTSTTGSLSSTDWNTFNSKLTSTLADDQIFIGNGSNVATAQTMSGDVTMSNTGVTTIGALKVTAAKISSGAATNGQFLTADGSGNATWTTDTDATQAPFISGSKATPNTYTTSGNISTASATNYRSVIFVAGLAAPATGVTISACTLVGQMLELVGKDSTNTVTLSDSTNVSVNGPVTLADNSMITFECDDNSGVWVEKSRR